eukprot:m.238440 g.238440  ORF g.238440 m.238440 type:complete len:504 (-) comp13301_c0_seq1:129-1640(-)
MDILLTIFLSILGMLLFGLLCILAFCLPKPYEYLLSRKIINTKTGKPLSNNNIKLPFGDLLSCLKDVVGAERSRLKYIPENAIGWWALNNYDVQLLNADWLRELLTMPDVKFNRSLESFKVLHRLLGTSLLGNQGEAWARMHKILYKAFQPSALASYVPFFISQTKEIANNIDASIATNTSYDMNLAFNDLTLAVMVDAGFGKAVSPADRKIILHAFRYLFMETQNPLHDIPILSKLPFPSNLECERQFRALHETADRIIAARKAMHASGEYQEAHDGKYVVDMLLDAHEEEGKLSDIELRDNVVMLLVAGSETTGTTLTWVLHYLTVYPDIKARVLAEIDTLDISWEHFNVTNFDTEMPYLTMVVSETLRDTPSIYGIPERIFTEDGTVGDLRLPKGSRVGVSQYCMHHNQNYWSEPDKFDPERFAPEASAARHRFAYLPFGLGRRQCMGKFFALNEIRVVIALLLKHYEFTYDASVGPVEVTWRPPTLMPKRGLPMFAKRR